ncbi:hypothetical protein AB0B54_09120 [Microbispora bryophytorum]
MTRPVAVARPAAVTRPIAVWPASRWAAPDDVRHGHAVRAGDAGLGR